MSLPVTFSTALFTRRLAVRAKRSSQLTANPLRPGSASKRHQLLILTGRETADRLGNLEIGAKSRSSKTRSMNYHVRWLRCGNWGTVTTRAETWPPPRPLALGHHSLLRQRHGGFALTVYRPKPIAITAPWLFDSIRCLHNRSHEGEPEVEANADAFHLCFAWKRLIYLHRMMHMSGLPSPFDRLFPLIEFRV